MTKPMDYLANFKGKNTVKGDPYVRGWCYICNSAHTWDKPCGSLDDSMVSHAIGEKRLCNFCHKEYEKTTLRRNYCSVECRNRGGTVRKKMYR